MYVLNNQSILDITFVSFHTYNPPKTKLLSRLPQILEFSNYLRQTNFSLYFCPSAFDCKSYCHERDGQVGRKICLHHMSNSVVKIHLKLEYVEMVF